MAGGSILSWVLPWENHQGSEDSLSCRAPGLLRLPGAGCWGSLLTSRSGPPQTSWRQLTPFPTTRNRWATLWLERKKVKLLSRVRLLATPWTVAYQAPLSVGFSKQEYWSGLPFPSPGVFPTRGSNPGLLHCRQTLYHLSHQGRCSLKTSWLEALRTHMEGRKSIGPGAQTLPIIPAHGCSPAPLMFCCL